MLDSVTMERRGLPTVVIGAEKLLRTTGRGMAKAQGFPDLKFAAISHGSGIMTSGDESAAFTALVRAAARQVEDLLLDPAVPRRLHD